MMRSGQFGPDPDTNATASPEYNADTYSGEAGLLGRLRALVHEQAVYQPAPANGGPPPSAPPDPKFRQLVRVSPIAEPQSTANFSDRYEFNPETYQGAGGLPGWMQAIMRSGQLGPDPDTNARVSPEYNPDTDSGEAGLLGRLRALAQEQAANRPASESSASASSGTYDPNFRQLVRISSAPSSPTSSASAPYENKSQPSPEGSRPNEMELAQQAREAAAVRIARGARGDSRAHIPAPDAADIAASAGIGFVNGAINTAGFPADILTGFGRLPKDFLVNGVRRLAGYPDRPADAPDSIRDYASADSNSTIHRELHRRFLSAQDGVKAVCGDYR